VPNVFRKIDYRELNSRQKEIFNFQKLSAVLADFGYVTLRLSDDWNGADFIAQHLKTKEFIKVQLKSRLTFDQKYHSDKDLYICFRDGEQGEWYMYNHAELLEQVDANGNIRKSKTWKAKKAYHFPTISEPIKDMLKRYLILDTDGPASDS
jgi:hypothetical protein